MTDSQRSRLIAMAGEMVLGKDMPPEFAEDWNVPKTTPRRAIREMEAAAKIARAMCREWSKKIMVIVDEGKAKAR